MDSLIKKTLVKSIKSNKDTIELNIVLIFNNTCAIRLGNFFSHKLVCLLEKKVLEASKI